MNQRILVVEDNKTLANIIAKKIKTQLQFEVDIAYSLQETKLFLKRYHYFLTLLDINLPDAPDGEVVDYALEKDNRAIVLSRYIDKAFRTKMLKKNIIDYVNKDGIHDIDYVIYAIQRLQKNSEHTVLVVDDSIVFRKQMQHLLENIFFNVITVAHGEEALGMLKAKPNISMVITDYNMPVMNGLDLTKEIRKEYSKNDLSILALSSNDDEEITALFLKEGANDYIRKPFSKEEFSCRVNNAIESLENIQIITNHANRDYLTGLYNRRYFFDNMHHYLEEDPEDFAIAMLDIDSFKTINDTYGHDVGDDAIVALSEILRSATTPKDLVSRFGGDEFCVVIKGVNKAKATEVFERICKDVKEYDLQIDKERYINFTISIGATMYSDASLEETINEADMMLYKAKNRGKNQVVFDD